MLKADLVIRNGIVVDGTGNPWFKADVAISKGRIVKVGRIEASAKEVIDAEGLIVAPGFIDIHSHDDLVFFRDKLNKPKLTQGVTTVVIGNCGMSPAPINENFIELLKSYTGILGKGVEFNWRSYGEFLEELERQGPLGTNVAGLVGHGTLRIAVMGMEARRATEIEIEKMKKLLARSLEEGAFGMSTGLIYPPGSYSNTFELIELAKVLASYGAIYATHMRNESDHVVEALMEAIRIGEESGARIEVSHIKASGRSNWGRMRKLLEMIEEARRRGVEVTADVYPYTAGSTMLAALLPPWVHEGGEEKFKKRCRDPKIRKEIRRFIEERSDWENFAKKAGWENIVISYSRSRPNLIGLSIAEASKREGKDPLDLVLDIIAEDGAEASMILFTMSEDDVVEAIIHPYVMFGTDGIDTGVGRPHPRTYGTFPRILSHYVREKKVLCLEEAVRKASSMPALKLGLRGRGLIRENYWADIVIFDLEKIRDNANYSDPRRYPEGIKYVIVNGVVSVEEGKVTGEAGGRILRRGIDTLW